MRVCQQTVQCAGARGQMNPSQVTKVVSRVTHRDVGTPGRRTELGGRGLEEAWIQVWNGVVWVDSQRRVAGEGGGVGDMEY